MEGEGSAEGKEGTASTRTNGVNCQPQYVLVLTTKE